ncbi:DUF6167 family protein [Streptacidiphilus rugosus]|uniref:DUF6167 family protein n=1 Tax=Streptacidiphilus rugosus TaxID=405783 RepID=UPI0006897629|nr:DUF6167 family protein [Streptacidiphilus rugosus]
MRRIFWMAVGAGATVWTINKANRMARSLTPGSLAEGAALGSLEIGRAARSFRDEVRAGMLQRELELNRQLGLDGSVLAAPGHPEAPVLRAAPLRAALPRAREDAPDLARPTTPALQNRTTPVGDTVAGETVTSKLDRNEDL